MAQTLPGAQHSFRVNIFQSGSPVLQTVSCSPGTKWAKFSKWHFSPPDSSACTFPGSPSADVCDGQLLVTLTVSKLPWEEELWACLWRPCFTDVGRFIFFSCGKDHSIQEMLDCLKLNTGR